MVLSQPYWFMSTMLYLQEIPSIVFESVKKFLHDTFKVKDLGDLKYFLGLEVSRSRKGIHI